MSFASFDKDVPRSNLHSRVALALGYAAVDAEHQFQVLGRSARVQTAATLVDYVDQLIRECNNVWNEYIEHPFPKQMANDTANLNGFRHYQIQDGLYLEHYYRVTTEAVAKSGSFDEIKKLAAKLAKSLDFVTSFRDDITQKLGVPKGDVTNEPKSKALLDSVALHEKVLKDGDWLDMHVVLLPCILGYDTIASKLLYDPNTIRNTIYYPIWILGNVGGSSPKNYREFINTSIGNLPANEVARRLPIWKQYFTDACKTEKAFFDLGISGPTVPQYRIVNDGTYKIRSYYRNTFFLYAKEANMVIIDNNHVGQWELKNSLNGYTIESKNGQTGFLNVIGAPPTQPPYQVKVSGEKAYWPINTVTVYDGTGKPYQAFQIFMPGRTEFVLDASRNPNDPKVFVTDNCQISSQLWVLEPA